MISFLLSVMVVTKDAISEVIENKVRYIFVSSEKEMTNNLSKLKVDASKVRFIDTNLPVDDWEKVAGVFKTRNEIYAYSEEIQSELTANLHSI